MLNKIIIVCILIFQASCVGLPSDIRPVDNFDLQRYLGKWYEVARLDHSFERGLTNVTAHYSVRANGGIKVSNTGLDQQEGEWNTAEGKAYFVGDDKTGHLKVSFFGPFYGSYVVFKIDEEKYQYAYVTSHSKNYLWLLSRTPSVKQELMDDFIATAQENGFATSEIIFVDQAINVQNQKGGQ